MKNEADNIYLLMILQDLISISLFLIMIILAPDPFGWVALLGFVVYLIISARLNSFVVRNIIDKEN